MKKILIVISIIIGLTLVFGSAGSLELDRIGFGQFFIQEIIGMVLCYVGASRVDF